MRNGAVYVCVCACSLELAIDSDRPGMLICRCPVDEPIAEIGLLMQMNSHGTTERPKDVVRNWKIVPFH